VSAIRKKTVLGERPMGSRRVNHENFFIAKICDSESAHSPFGSCGRRATRLRTHRADDERVAKSASIKAFSATSTIDGVDLSGISRIVHRVRRDAFARNAACALAFPCQHFFKREAVFFDALVYSEWSAFRFPSARSD